MFKFSAADAKADWTRFILGVYRVQDRPQVLAVWLGGEGAKAVERLPNEKIIDDLTIFTRKYFGKEYPDIPAPKDMKVDMGNASSFFHREVSPHR